MITKKISSFCTGSKALRLSPVFKKAGMIHNSIKLEKFPNAKPKILSVEHDGLITIYVDKKQANRICESSENLLQTYAIATRSKLNRKILNPISQVYPVISFVFDHRSGFFLFADTKHADHDDLFGGFRLLKKVHFIRSYNELIGGVMLLNKTLRSPIIKVAARAYHIFNKNIYENIYDAGQSIPEQERHDLISYLVTGLRAIGCGMDTEIMDYMTKNLNIRKKKYSYNKFKYYTLRDLTQKYPK